jgi:hypothetical protein
MTHARRIHSHQAAVPEPFWQRLRPITLYPVRGAALYTLIALTLFSLLTFVPGIGTFMRGLLWLTAYKYGFEILRATADGRADSPEGPLSFDNGVVWRLIALQVVAIAAVFVVLLVAGPIAALVALAAVTFVQPGCIMSLAMDGSLRRAINPAVSFGVVARIGWPYLAVVGLLFVIQASAGAASGFLAGWLPPVIGDLGITFLSLWALFATFHLMGYLVFQYHEALGYTPEALHSALPDLHRPDAALLEDAESLVRDGHTVAAIERLRGETRVRAISVEAHELLHRLLRQSGDAQVAAEHGATYLNLLMLERRERDALVLARTLLDLDRDFVPLQAAHVSALVARAREVGQSQLAADLLEAALRRHPRDVEAPRWGLDLGMLLVDRLGRDADARIMLDQARSRCDDDALRMRIDAALQLVRALPA